jgi:hypothetical protein
MSASITFNTVFVSLHQGPPMGRRVAQIGSFASLGFHQSVKLLAQEIRHVHCLDQFPDFLEKGSAGNILGFSLG